MAQLNYFRGQTSGGVPAGLGQATNTGMAVGISKGMDALARGLEKFFQNKREQAEEDAYAELLKKLNEVPDTKEVGRKSAEEVASGTPGLPVHGLLSLCRQGSVGGLGAHETSYDADSGDAPVPRSTPKSFLEYQFPRPDSQPPHSGTHLLRRRFRASFRRL